MTEAADQRLPAGELANPEQPARRRVRYRPVLLLIGAALAAALIASVAMALRRAPPPLLSIATRVTPPGFVADDATAYEWRPDGSLLLAQPAPPNVPRVLRWLPRERRMDRVATVKPAAPRVSSDCTLSPDGRWLACANDSATTTIVDLSTGACRTYTGALYTMAFVPCDFGVVWSPDGRRCAGYNNADGMVTTVSMATGHIDRSSRAKGLHLAVGWTPSGLLFLTDAAEPKPGEHGHIQLADLDPSSGRVTFHRAIPLPPDVPVSLPYDMRMLGGSVSPRGDRAAVLVVVQRQSSSPRWMRRVLGWLGQKPPSPAAEIWSFRLDGADMHEVGSVAAPPASALTTGGPAAFTNALPVRLHWTPDGKRIGFIYKGAIYTVPADSYP